MAWTFIQGLSSFGTASVNATTSSISLPNPTTAGSLIVIFAQKTTSNTGSVLRAFDNVGNEYSVYPASGSYNAIALWMSYGIAATSSATTHSIISDPAYTWHFTIGEFSSNVGITSVEVFDTASTSRQNVISVLTSSAAGQLIVNGVGYGAAPISTASANYTLFFADVPARSAASYKLSGDVYENPVMTSSQAFRATINASFKESSPYIATPKYMIWQFDD